MGDESHGPENVSGVCNAASRRAIRLFSLHFDAMVYARQLAERTGKKYAVVLGNRYADRAWKVVLRGE